MKSKPVVKGRLRKKFKLVELKKAGDADMRNEEEKKGGKPGDGNQGDGVNPGGKKSNRNKAAANHNPTSAQ